MDDPIKSTCTNFSLIKLEIMTEARDLLYSASGPHHHRERRDAFSATSTPQPKRPPNHTHPIIISTLPIGNRSTFISIVKRFPGKTVSGKRSAFIFIQILSDKVCWIVFWLVTITLGFIVLLLNHIKKCMHRKRNQ